ncbi:MAG: ABC transporter substrate-binding protein [Bdellovibrionota bacterium]
MKNLLQVLFTVLITLQIAMAEERIKTAAFLPLSGPWSPNGYYTQEGIELALTSLKKDGIHLDVKFEDVCFAKDAVTSLKSLTLDSSIEGIVANYCVLSLAAIKSIVEREKIITFQNSIAPGNLIDNEKLIYSTFPTADEESKVIAEHAYNTLGARRVAILQLMTQWGIGFANKFTKHFENLGGKVVFDEQQATPVNDFRPELSRIKNTNIDTIFLAHVGADLVLALKQIASLGIKAKLVATSEVYDDHIIKEGRSYANGLSFFIPKLNPENEYVKRLMTEYPKDKLASLRPLTSHAYLSTLTFGKGRTKCGKDKGCLSSFLKNEMIDIRGGGSWDSSKFQKVEIKNQEFVKAN